MKKKVLAALLAAAMVASLAACGDSASSDSSSTDSSSTVASEAPTSYSVDEIKINIWDNNQKDGLQAIADDWTAISGVKVSIEVVDWDNYWTLLEAGASGGTMPDVFWMHSNTAQMYMEADMLLDLTQYVERDGIDLSQYYEGVLNLYTREDGNIYALPKDHDTIALLYNKAIFDQYGVAYPDETDTWETIAEKAAAITSASNGDVYGIAMNTSNNQDGWYNVVYSYGGQIITDDHKGTTIGSDEGKAGMEAVRQLLVAGGCPQDIVSSTGTESLFKSGKCAMITQGSWMINSFYTAENAADYAWAIMPYGDANGNGTCDEGERWSAYNGLGWAAAYNVADPEACVSLIEYFCSAEAQQKQAELGVTMGGMTGVSQAFADAFPGMDVSAFIDVEETGSLFFRPYTKNTTVWEDAIQTDAFITAWQDPTNADAMAAACDAAQEIIDNAIAQE